MPKNTAHYSARRLASIFIIAALAITFLTPGTVTAACLDPSFTQKTVTASDTPQDIFLIDLDEDGDTDIVGGSYSGDGVAWYENDGSGNFTANTIAGSDSAFSVHAVDVDGDLDQDVLAAMFGSDTIAWYENDGSESFTRRVITTTADGATAVYGADIDGDGDTDVLSGSAVDDSIAWYENDGSETFSKTTIASLSNPEWVIANNLDQDSDMDIVALGSTGSLVWYDNDGSQSFTTRNIGTAGSSAFGLHVIDFDGDGDTDAVASGLDEINWFDNDGSQTFTKRSVESNFTSDPGGIWTADIDADGDQDVVSIDLAEDVNWYENDGSQTFTKHTVGTGVAYSGAAGVSAGDLDGDNDLDIVAAADGEGALLWFEQTCNDPVSEGSGTPSSNGSSSGGGGPILREVALLQGTVTKPKKTNITRRIIAFVGNSVDVHALASDFDQVQTVKLRTNGQLHNLTDDNDDGIFNAVLPAFAAAGRYRYALTADWGVTTQTEHGEFVIIENQDVVAIPLINSIFRLVYGRSPLQSEWQYWALRREEKSAPPDFLGALQWHFLHGISH